MYIFESRVRYSELGADEKLTFPALIDYFQDCSSFHSEDLGVGQTCLDENHLAWIVNFWQVRVFRYPGLGEQIRTGTSPYEMKGFMGFRNFCMETAEGERLAEAASVWSLMDRESMSPRRIPPEMLERYTLSEPFPMKYASRKIPVPEGEGEKGSVICVEEYHLDVNLHVNNSQYIRFVLAQLPEALHPVELQIEYKSQARLGDRIFPEIYRREGDPFTTVALRDREGKDYVIARVQTEQDGILQV